MLQSDLVTAVHGCTRCICVCSHARALLRTRAQQPAIARMQVYSHICHFAIGFVSFSASSELHAGCRAGEVHRMCPVAPFGLHLSMLLIHQLRPDDGTPSAVLRWLQEATGVPELGAPLDTLRRTESSGAMRTRRLRLCRTGWPAWRSAFAYALFSLVCKSQPPRSVMHCATHDSTLAGWWRTISWHAPASA